MTETAREDEALDAGGRWGDLAYSAWVIIANAHEGDWNAAPPDWRKAAERWRDRFHEMLADPGMRLPPPRETTQAELRDIAGTGPETIDPASATLPEGIFARVELPGYRQHTGWVTEETQFGTVMAVIRDWDHRVIAAAALGPGCQVVHLPTPRKRPEPPQAITARADNEYDWDDDMAEPAL
jgi:hypothetical protein